MKENKLDHTIKVGFCVAYDWALLQNSVPRIYPWADSICLSIDKHRKTWAGKSYEFDEQAFKAWVKSVDTANKISVYEDNFSLPSLTPIENDNRQRTLMADFMGQGGWHVQIDSDEYFLDFEGFVHYLKQLRGSSHVNICCNWISLIKKVKGGFLYVKQPGNNFETMPFATRQPKYENARRNGYFNHISPFFVIHETWARGEEELWAKLNSWGHKNDFHKESYFALWKSLDASNYRYVVNFHPIQPDVWPALAFGEGETVTEFIDNLQKSRPFFIPSTALYLKNSRNLSRLRAILQKLS